MKNEKTMLVYSAEQKYRWLIILELCVVVQGDMNNCTSSKQLREFTLGRFHPLA